MLNQELQTRESKEIFRLTRTIEAFKAYDEERKQYIKNLERELQWHKDELESKEEMLRDIGCDGAAAKLREKVAKQKKELKACMAKISLLNRKEPLVAGMDDDVAELHLKIASLQGRIKSLESQNRTLRSTNKVLIMRLNHGQKSE